MKDEDNPFTKISMETEIQNVVVERAYKNTDEKYMRDLMNLLGCSEVIIIGEGLDNRMLLYASSGIDINKMDSFLDQAIQCLKHIKLKQSH